MARPPRSPFDGVDRLIVDASNLLYRIARPAGGGGGSRAEPGGAAPPAAIVGRLRAVVPGSVAIDLVFDGPGHGVRGRVAERMFVRHAGMRSADDAIVDLAAAAGDAAQGSVLVVTDDRELRSRLAAVGARTLPAAWLLERLGMPRLAAPAPGNRRPPVGLGSLPGGVRDTDELDGERRGWRPGRGATSKTGPARRVARHRRHPRHPG